MAVSQNVPRNESYEETAHLCKHILNNQLPIAVTANDLNRNPEFSKLLISLGQRITDTGLSSATNRDLSEAKETLLKQKRRWLQCHTLYSEIQELILDHRLQTTQSVPSDSQFYKMVGEMLAYAEVGEYLDCDPEPGSNVTLLGLDVDKLDRINSHKSHRQSMLQKLIPDVESRLRRRCESLVNFHDTSPNISAGNTRLEFAKASQLPAVIAAEQHQLAGEKQLLKKDTAERRKLTAQYRHLLTESFDLLQRLLINHRLKSQPENDVIASEWLAARCDAMCLKIKVLELQLLYDTYYAETVRALTVVRSELDTSIADTERELNRVTAAVRAYESVGNEFDTIVDEFTRLRAEVDNRRWALHELKKHSLDRQTGGEEPVNHSFLS